MSGSMYEKLVLQALEEDVGHDDVTTRLTVSEDARCTARLVAKQDGVLSGIEVFRLVFELVEAELEHWESSKNGSRIASGDTVAAFSGSTRSVLTAERTALNFLQRLSGVATLTDAYVRALSGTHARVCDTRKTTPGLRMLEKEAVSHGGGANHRHGLYDGILIKENHIEAAGGIAMAVERVATGAHHLMKVEVEVRSLDELQQALDARADAVLLDNMSIDDMERAVAMAKAAGVVSEASGNVTLDTIRPVAETGVDFISVGALTHSAPALDFSLLIEKR